MVFNEYLNHKEEEGSQIDVSLNLADSEILGQEGFCLLDSFEEMNDNYFEMHEKKEVINLEILNEVVVISFENFLEDSFKKQFESVQEKLHFEQLCQ